MRHRILFLAANAQGTARPGFDREASAIQSELERAGCRDSFELVTRWAAEPLDLLREIRKVKPAVVHFAGHGGERADDAHQHRVADGNPADQIASAVEGGGLHFQGRDGKPVLVSTGALTSTLASAGASVRLVVLGACGAGVQAQALLEHVDCVIDVVGSIEAEAATTFAMGFYGGLAERASVVEAFQQGQAAIRLAGLHGADNLQLRVREGVDAKRLVLGIAGRRNRRAGSSTQLDENARHRNRTEPPAK